MPRRTKEESASASGAIDFAELAAGIAQAMLGAKLRLDQFAAAIADQYKANPVLRALSPPAFAIGEVRVTVKFAIAQLERAAPAAQGAGAGAIHLQIHVDTASLTSLAPHLISEIEFRIAPQVRPAQGIED